MCGLWVPSCLRLERLGGQASEPGIRAFANSSEGGARGPCNAPGTHCNLLPQPPPAARSVPLPLRGDGPAQCNGAHPEAVGRGCGQQGRDKVPPLTPHPQGQGLSEPGRSRGKGKRFTYEWPSSLQITPPQRCFSFDYSHCFVSKVKSIFLLPRPPPQNVLQDSQPCLLGSGGRDLEGI